MKTVFDKMLILIQAGETISLSLPEPFRIDDSLFLLVHNCFGETLKVTLTSEAGCTATQCIKLDSFPTIIAFSAYEEQPMRSLNTLPFVTVSFTAFQEIEGALTFRTKNPPHVLRAYRQE